MDVEQSVILSDVSQKAEFMIPGGYHKLEWVYKKFNKFDQSDDLSAEIYWIVIRGTKLMDQECQVCSKGIPNETKDRCIPCQRDEYESQTSDDTNTCLPCPPDKYSPPGSVGEKSCKKRPTCRDEDHMYTLTECVNGKRDQKYSWREPKICTSVPKGAASLPSTGKGYHCRGCMRGNYRDEDDKCVACETGHY